MEKKALGVMILLVVLSIFTGHWLVAILLPMFEYFSRKYLYPEIKRLVSEGWTKESLLKTINDKDDIAIFGLLLALVLYLMILKEILTSLIMNFGVWSFIMAALYIIVPVLGILGRSKKV